MTCREALDVVNTAMQHAEPRHFQIALVGYFLDRRPYPADGLAVNAANTPNFATTQGGFTCEGFFPPALLHAKTVRDRQIIRSASGVEMIRLRIDVDSRDVWAIAEFIDGRQHDLFIDPGVMMVRKFAFATQAAACRESLHDRF